MDLIEWLRAACGAREADGSSGSRKLLPVIDTGYCNGCGLCVEACERGCMQLVWDFARLQRPQDCLSDGGCAEACPEKLIRMDWVPATGDETVGRWRPGAAPSPGTAG